MRARTVITIPFLAVLATVALASSPARQAITTLMGTEGPTGQPGIDAALAQRAQTLLASTCPGGQAIASVDPATGALLCAALPNPVTSVSAASGLVSTPAGTTRTISANGTYGADFTVSGNVTARESNAATTRVLFTDDSTDPGYWALEATDQAGGAPASARLAFKFKRPNGAGGELTPFVLDGARGFSGAGRVFGAAVASGLTAAHSNATEVFGASHTAATNVAFEAQGRIDFLGSAALGGTIVDGRTFAMEAGLNGSATASYTAANAVRLPIYHVVEGPTGAAGVTASCQGSDLALGGGCDNGLSGGDYIIGNTLGASTFHCSFIDAASNSAHVVCLRSY